MELPTCPASALSFIEELIRNYRSLDCSCCQKHLLFQNRLNPNLMLCSAKCVANYKEDSLSDTASLCSVSSSVRIPDKEVQAESPSCSSASLDFEKSVQTAARSSKRISDERANELLTAIIDPQVAENGFPAASNDRPAASNDPPAASNDLPAASNDLTAASNDLTAASNDLKTNGHSSPVHSDKGSAHSVGKKPGHQNGKKKKQDPSQLFKREGTDKYFRLPPDLPKFDNNPSRFPARNSSPSVLQPPNKNNYPPTKSYHKSSSNDVNSNWRSSGESKKSCNFSSPKEFQKMFLLDLKQSKSLRNGSTCVISHIWDPSRFTVQFVEDLPDLKELEREIEAHCGTAAPIRRTPLVNEVILASNSAGSGEYRRAVVTKFCHQRPVVRFLDTGDEVPVDLHDCCEIPERLAKDYSIYGAEMNVTLPEDLRDSVGKEIGKLQEAVTGKEFIVDNILESKPRGRWTGNLRLKDSSSQTYESLVEKLLKQTDADEDESSKDNDLKNGSQLFLLENCRRSASFRHKSEVAIQFMWNLRKLTLVAQEDRMNLVILEEAIAEHVDKADPMTRDPVPGEVLLAPYNDGIYYRAEVMEVNLPDVFVQFLDYGDSKNVPATDLRELNKEIYEHPIYGVTWTMPDIPHQADDDKLVTIKELQIIADRGGPAQVDVENCVNSVWSGRLWVDQSQTWNEIAIKALQMPKESEEIRS